MKDCVDIAIELPGYASGKLAPDASASVRRHLQSCDVCQLELAAVERLDALLSAALPPVQPSRTFASTFANRLAAAASAEEERGSAGGWREWLFRPWLLPLAAAAVFAAIMLVARSSQKSSFPLPHFPSLKSGLAAAPKKPATEPAVKIAGAAPVEKEKKTVVASAPPDDLVQRPELFMDYAVIRDLDVLESAADGVDRAG